MKKLSIYALFFNLVFIFGVSVSAVNLNFDMTYEADSKTTETSTGTTKSSVSSLYFIASLLIVDFSGVKLGASYYKENSDAIDDESIVGAVISYGEDFFIELVVGPYSKAQSAGSDLIGLGFIFIPGKIFSLGSNVDFRVSLPFIQREYDNSAGDKVSHLTYAPFVGLKINF
jgi:hypothetical protein